MRFFFGDGETSGPSVRWYSLAFSRRECIDWVSRRGVVKTVLGDSRCGIHIGFWSSVCIFNSSVDDFPCLCRGWLLGLVLRNPSTNIFFVRTRSADFVFIGILGKHIDFTFVSDEMAVRILKIRKKFE